MAEHKNTVWAICVGGNVAHSLFLKVFKMTVVLSVWRQKQWLYIQNSAAAASLLLVPLNQHPHCPRHQVREREKKVECIRKFFMFFFTKRAKNNRGAAFCEQEHMPRSESSWQHHQTFVRELGRRCTARDSDWGQKQSVTWQTPPGLICVTSKLPFLWTSVLSTTCRSKSAKIQLLHGSSFQSEKLKNL